MAEAFTLPRMSDTMEEGTVASLHIKVGDYITSGDVVADIETDKTTMELESFQEGHILYLAVQEGESIPIDGLIAILGEKDEDYQTIIDQMSKPTQSIISVEENKKEETEQVSSKTTSSSKVETAQITIAPKKRNQRIKISPLAKRLALEHHIDTSLINGSGTNGRIIKKDIESYINKPHSPVLFEKSNDIPLSGMRKTIAKRLASSKQTAPHFYLNVSIQMDKVIEIRQSLNEWTNKKISINDILVKAVAIALEKHPSLNASWQNEYIKQYEHVHIGMAVSVKNGLIVPVIKHANKQSIQAISQTTKKLITQAKDNKLQPDDIAGHTFTLSNLGMLGIESFTAIINPPNVSILAIGTISKKPIIVDEQIRIASIMQITLSSDHRAVDGVTGALFLKDLKHILEHPSILLL